jgi:predicted acyl esterase
MSLPCGRIGAGFILGSAMLLASATVPAFSESVPNETPATFVPSVDSFDYTKREVMIPMRDGIKLQTVILIPHGAPRADAADPHALRGDFPNR